MVNQYLVVREQLRSATQKVKKLNNLKVKKLILLGSEKKYKKIHRICQLLVTGLDKILLS